MSQLEIASMLHIDGNVADKFTDGSTLVANIPDPYRDIAERFNDLTIHKNGWHTATIVYCVENLSVTKIDGLVIKGIDSPQSLSASESADSL